MFTLGYFYNELPIVSVMDCSIKMQNNINPFQYIYLKMNHQYSEVFTICLLNSLLYVLWIYK